ncbi:MAG: hypothetical protein U0324_07715 [Polyangiales bacterium]
MSDPSDDMPDALRSLTEAMREAPRRDAAAEDALARAVEAAVRGLVPVLPDGAPADAPEVDAPPPSPTTAAPRGVGTAGRVLAAVTFLVGVGVGVGVSALLRGTPRTDTIARTVTTQAHPLPATTPTIEAPPDAPPQVAREAPSTLAAAAPPALAPPAHAAHDGGSGEGPVELSAARVREQLQRAEQLLDDGHAAEALTRLRALDRMTIRSPVLAGVREVLAVRALRETGHVAEADERARRYLRAHPGSAHVRELNAPNGGDR